MDRGSMDQGWVDRLYFGAKGKISGKTKGGTEVKTGLLWKNQCAEVTLVKTGCFREKTGLLGKISV